MAPRRSKQIEGLIQRPVRAGAGPVHLVDDHDRFETARERLLGHEPGLRHRSVHGIDQDQHGVHHRQDALDLPAEIGVARRIDDVDPVAAPAQGGILREDGDPSFALEIVAVHDSFGRRRALTERPGLLQQTVHQGRLAVIDMGDDGDIAEFIE